MKCSVDEHALREVLSEILKVTGETPPLSVVEPPVKELPVEPSPEASTEGVFQMPPVHDDNWQPKNPLALSQAAYALAKEVPPEEVADVYSRLQRLVQSAKEQPNQESGLTLANEVKKKVIDILREAINDEDDVIPARPVHPTTAALADLDSDDPGWDSSGDATADAAEIARMRDQSKIDAESRVKPSWSDIRLGRKKPKADEFEGEDRSGYMQEPTAIPGTEGNAMSLEDLALLGAGRRGDPMSAEKQAQLQRIMDRLKISDPKKLPDIGDLNTNSAVKQHIQDPRRLNLLDKFWYVTNMSPQQRHRVVISAGADFLEKIALGGKVGTLSRVASPMDREVPAYGTQSGNLLYSDTKNPNRNIVLDPADPAVRIGIKKYIKELQADEALDSEDVLALHQRTDMVCELESFKYFFLNLLNQDVNVLLKFGPFREFLSVRWSEILRQDPTVMDAVARRKVADEERVRMDKAAKAAKTTE